MKPSLRLEPGAACFVSNLYSGPTVHFVDEHFDTGKTLAQRVVPVLPNDTPEQLAARVLVRMRSTMFMWRQLLPCARTGLCCEKTVSCLSELRQTPMHAPKSWCYLEEIPGSITQVPGVAEAGEVSLAIEPAMLISQKQSVDMTCHYIVYTKGSISHHDGPLGTSICLYPTWVLKKSRCF